MKSAQTPLHKVQGMGASHSGTGHFWRERVTAVDVKPAFEARWNRWLQSRMNGTSWTMSRNYFTAPSGKVVTQWPYGNTQYRLLTKVLGRVSETTRRRNMGDES